MIFVWPVRLTLQQHLFFSSSVFLPQLPFQFLETLQGTLEVFDDVISKFVGIGKIVEVSKGLVLNPEDIKARFVTFQNILNLKFAEATFWILLFRIGFLAFEAIFGIVALDKILQILVGKGILLQREMDIGSKIVYPDFFGLQKRFFCCSLLTKYSIYAIFLL